ncbi:MAG: cytochrome c maturation protein CcmE [Chloroflexi bacterium]|nr:cytochrome c maturation protein CcmE [Chloroflexota bacterium]
MRSKKFFIGIPVVIIAIGLLFFNAVRSGNFYYTVSELKSMGEEAYQQNIRVEGLVQADNLKFDARTRETRFVIEDVEKAGVTMPVVYRGVVPDTFAPGVTVVAEGKYGRDGTFQATNLMAKCASKYEPAVS